jgi:hypothetical protein
MEIHQFLHHAMPLRPRRSQNNGLKARVILGTPQPLTLPYLRRFVLFIYLLFYFILFSPFFWCSGSGNHPLESLAKFGYKKNNHHSLLWLHATTQSINLANCPKAFFFPKIGWLENHKFFFYFFASKKKSPTC